MSRFEIQLFSKHQYFEYVTERSCSWLNINIYLYMHSYSMYNIKIYSVMSENKTNYIETVVFWLHLKVHHHSVCWWFWNKVKMLQFHYSFVLFWLIYWVFRMALFFVFFRTCFIYIYIYIYIYMHYSSYSLEHVSFIYMYIYIYIYIYCFLNDTTEYRHMLSHDYYASYFKTCKPVIKFTFLRTNLNHFPPTI